MTLFGKTLLVYIKYFVIILIIRVVFCGVEGDCQDVKQFSINERNIHSHYIEVRDLRNDRLHRSCIALTNKILDSEIDKYYINYYSSDLLNSKALSYSSIGHPFVSETNFFLAIQYGILTHQIQKQAMGLSNLSSLFLKLGIEEISIQIIKKLITSGDSTSISELLVKPEAGIRLNNLAEAFRQKGSFVESEMVFDILISNIENFYKDVGFRPEITFRNFGRLKLQQCKLEQALQMFLQALQISLENNGPTNFQTAKCHYHLAQCHDQMGNYDQALQNFNQAIEIMEESLQDKSNEEYSYETSYIEMLTGRGEFLLKQGRFEEALADFVRAINRVNLFVNTYQAETTRFFIADVGVKAFKLGILCQMRMNPENRGNLDQAFEWSLQAKSMSSYYTTKRDFRYPEAGMPVDSLYKLQSTREEIQTWMDGIDILSIRKEDIDPNDLFRMVQLVVDYELLEQYVQGEYLKVREKLEETKESDYLNTENFQKEVYLGYQDLDSLLLVFGVNKNGRFNKIIPCDSVLRSDFIRIKDIISKPHYGMNTRSEINEFAALAQQVYRSVLLPVQDELLDNKLVIHPDGILLGLPFECLIDLNDTFESSSYKDLPFLINSFKFRYVATPFLRTNYSDRQSRGNNLLISCAGENNSEIGLEETKGLYRYFDEESIMSLPELAEDYKSELEVSDHIHILSHQVSNQDDFMSSGLVCDLNDQNRYLTFKDILFTRLNHPSVYINSCESGNGPMGNGEGLMSLSLAFTLAGAKSVVQHMWEADDETSGQIAIRYYKGKKRLPESEALQQGKLKYLKKAPAGKDHPHYWAGVVYYGSRSKPTHPVWIILLGGFIILIIGWGVWKNYRR